MKKRILSIALTLALCLGLLPVTALADDLTIYSNNPLDEAVRGKSYEQLLWGYHENVPYEWMHISGTLPPNLILSEETRKNFGDCYVIRGTVDQSAPLGEYTFTVKVTDGSNSGTKECTIVVAEQVGKYLFLPKDNTVQIVGTPSGSDKILPATVTLGANSWVELWKDDNRSNSTTFTAANGAPAKFTYLGSEPGHTIELISGAVTLGAGDGVHATINGEMYTIAANDGSTATFTASTGGATISTTGGVTVAFAGNTFSFTAEAGKTATMTITLTDSNTKVVIDKVASVTLNDGDPTAPPGGKYENMSLPALYPLYIEGKQVTSEKSTGTGWSFNPTTYTLTLTGATLAGVSASGENRPLEEAVPIYYNAPANGKDLTIELEGDNSLTALPCPSGWSSGIYVAGADLTIKEKTGQTGSLVTEGAVNTVSDYGSAGIYVVNGDLDIQGGTITAKSNSCEVYSSGIFAEGQTVTISGSAKVTATADGGDKADVVSGIKANTIEIEDTAYVKAQGVNPQNTAHALDVGIGGSVSIYEATDSNDYNIKTTTNGTTTVTQRSVFIVPNAAGWSNITYFEMPYTGNAYRVTYNKNESTSGDEPMDSNLYPDGAAVTVLGADGLSKSGHTFNGWNTKVDGSGTTYQPNSSFLIGAHTTLYAVWTPTPPSSNSDPSYRITVEETDNGEVTSNRSRAKSGRTITLTVTPEQGYELTSLTVTDRRGNEIDITDKGDGVYTFRMPSRDVTVTASFDSDWNLGYRDCPRDHTCPYWPYTDTDTHAWYHNGVHFCVENGLMIGYEDNSFQPDISTTRAMITVMLWRLNGSPVVSQPLAFTDVPADAWYTEAVRWASAEAVVLGYGNGLFGPNDDVTREQMATILWRYAQHMGYDVSVGEDTNILSYDDAFTVSQWAIPAMQWACGSGMIVGIEKDGGMYLDPLGSTTRAQMATMMMRFCAEIVK